MNSIRSSLVVILFATLSACGVASGGGGSATKSDGATASLSLTFPEGAIPDCATCAAAPSYVTGATLTISGELLDAPEVQQIPVDTGVVEGELQAGVYTFAISVTTTNFGTFTGSTTTTLSPGVNNPVNIKLSLNAPPTIDSFTYTPSNPSPGSSVTFNATTSDLDNDPLTFSWTATGGTISGTGGAATLATSANATSASVTLTVTDGHGGTATRSATITLLSPPATPTGFACSAGFSKLGLSWHAVANATSYKVYSNGSPNATTATTFDYTASLHETGSFQVSAVNAAGESAKSATLNCQEQTGIKWTNRGTVAAGELTYGGGLFMLGDYAGNNRVFTSNDGITWTTQALGVANAVSGDVLWTGAEFIAVGTSGSTGYRHSSSTGIGWVNTIVNGPVTQVWGPYQIVGSGANLVTMSSQNDNNYTCHGVGTAAGCSALAFGAGIRPRPGVWNAGGFAIIPDTGGSVWVSSTTAVGAGAWNRRLGPVLDTSFQDAAHANGLYVVVGNNTLGAPNQAPIYTSTDAVTWTSRTSNVTGSNLNEVIRAGNWWIAAGSGITFSSDGTKWEAPVANPGGSPYVSLAYNGTKLVAVQSSGVVWTSP